MGDNWLHQLGNLMSGAFALNEGAFQTVVQSPRGQTLAFLVVLVAGLSLAIAQSIILFINQVKPFRFVFSLLLNAILFVFGFLFLVLSTWLIGWIPGAAFIRWADLLKGLGLSYAPLLFSFLGALPYAGVPILNLLSVWHLLAMVAAVSAIAQIGGSQAFVHVGVGWVALQLLQNTVGQPIARFGRELADRVAGVDLAQDHEALLERLRPNLGAASSPMLGAPQPIAAGASLPEGQLITPQWAIASRTPLSPTEELAPPPAVMTDQAVAPPPVIPRSDALGDRVRRLLYRTRHVPQPIQLVLTILGFLLLFALVAILLQPIRLGLFGWYRTLPRAPRLLFDLVWIGTTAIIFAGLLAPLETLGWWAGWFGDSLDTVGPPTWRSGPQMDQAESSESPDRPSRYLIYLDGVAQSGQEYTPDVEDFLTALEPALPPDVCLVRGLMMYSVLNKPLYEDRPLAFLWQLADKMRWQNPAALLGILVNLRNVLIVAVSADQRYGPIYNRGIAQILYDGLRNRGYEPGSTTPITLVGYSGGGQMSAAAAPYLTQALGVAIDVISLGGVISASSNFLKLDHLYHFFGEKDVVQRLGPLMFPGRRKWAFLSYWNRARRKGKISMVSAGPMGHQVPGGYMDPNARLPNGRTHLQHTVDLILQILAGDLLQETTPIPVKLSNYARYKQAPFNDPSYYPLHRQPARLIPHSSIDSAPVADATLPGYTPIAPWMGRLILPQRYDRARLRGVLLEVHHTPPGYEHLVGQVVKLGWVNTPFVKNLVRAVTRDIHFSADAEYGSKYGGSVHPDRLNHWQQVGPLESLAGAHPVDDIIVMLPAPVEVETSGDQAALSDSSATPSSVTLRIRRQPVQITGRYYGLVQFRQPLPESDRWGVVHFNPETRQFDGAREIVRLPAVVLAAAYGSYPSTSRDVEQGPLNEAGWYIYGSLDVDGVFVVQSWMPRAVLRLQPERVVFGSKAAYRYIRRQSWADSATQKGRISSVLCTPTESSIQAAVDQWQVGDRALVIHVYGGIGGAKAEPAAATPIFFGHFAYGVAVVIQDPISQEQRFDLNYYQVYTQNTDGLVAGALHGSRYLGDRQFGWLGNRPICDILIKLDCFTNPYLIQGQSISPLDLMLRQLEAMTARYRTGDGTGGTYVGPANNCAQDSNRALFASIATTQRYLRANPEVTQALLANPAQAQRFEQLKQLGRDLERQLQPWGDSRVVWENNEYNLGCTLEDDPVHNLMMGLGSWRTLLPRLASDTVVKIFLQHGASVWVLRSTQVGGYDPDIAPISPITL
jgi:predicted Abi (CAAX) family protease